MRRAVAPMSDTAASPPVPLVLERVPCPLCGSEQSDVLVRTTDHPGGFAELFTIERCRGCGHGFMNPRPTRDSIADCYPATYGPHQALPAAPGRVVATEAAADSGTRCGRPWILRCLPLGRIPGLRSFYHWLMEDHSQLVPHPMIRDNGSGGSAIAPPSALELGCATGSYLLRLQQAGWTVVGVEPSPGASAMARAAGLTVHTGTLDDFDPGDRQFDLAAAWMVLEHVPDPRATLRTLHRLLKPSGQLLLSIPNASCWETLCFGRYWYGWEPPRHLQHFSVRSVRRLLTECGFDSIVVQHQRNVSYIPGSLGLLIISFVPGSRMGRWLLRYPGTPTTFGKLLTAPLAHLLSWLQQGGRLTISAERR